MRILALVAACAALAAPAARAQQDTTTRARTRADSIARAVQDSIALMKELGGALSADTTRAAPSGTGAQTGPTNPRLLPDFSTVGDFIADLSPKRSTQGDGTRLGVREVEIAVQAVVDPYFRGDVFLGISDLEGLSIEQAYLTTTSLPNQLELKLGRFLMPFGKQNTTHRHDLHTIEYPYVLQRFLSADGLKGTGFWGSRVFAPVGFFQELSLTVVDRVGERDDLLISSEPPNRTLGGLGYSARLRNYVDISEAANLELSFSAMTGRREQLVYPFYFAPPPGGTNAVNARQSTLAVDATYRWRPLQQGLYHSFMVQGELLHQINEDFPQLVSDCVTNCTVPVAYQPGSYVGSPRDFTGGYVYSRYQSSQRTFLGARVDVVQDPLQFGSTLRAGSAYFEFFPSEFSKLVLGYEGVSQAGAVFLNRLLAQATFSLGPHKPHPF